MALAGKMPSVKMMCPKNEQKLNFSIVNHSVEMYFFLSQQFFLDFHKCPNNFFVHARSHSCRVFSHIFQTTLRRLPSPE